MERNRWYQYLGVFLGPTLMGSVAPYFLDAESLVTNTLHQLYYRAILTILTATDPLWDHPRSKITSASYYS